MLEGRNQEAEDYCHHLMTIDSESVTPWDEGPSWMHYRADKIRTEIPRIPKIPVRRSRPAKQITQPKLQPISHTSSPQMLQTKYQALKTKQFNSFHSCASTNGSGDAENASNTNTNMRESSSRDKLYEMLQQLHSKNKNSSVNRAMNQNNLAYYRKKQCVGNQYAKWKNKIDMITRSKNYETNSNTPRLPKIELCWL